MMRGLKEHEGYWHFRPKNREPQQEATRGKKKKKNTNWKKKTGLCKPTRGKTKWFILALPPSKYTCSHTLDRPTNMQPQ
jgi:hypothetical protein